MNTPISRFAREYRALRAFESLERQYREIVFYSEGAADWPHLGPVIRTLLTEHERDVTYLTSEANDPGLGLQHPRLRSIDIGSGTVRTMLFRRINCGRFVMTLTDLDRFWLKRSLHPVRYVYLFHSINSTHTAYRSGAFDAYDTILCVGPHHIDEIRRTEAVYQLPAKELIEHGSVRLDSLLTEPRASAGVREPGPLQVLVAPSWGPCSLIERPLGRELIDTLVQAGIKTVLRLHPMTERHFPKLIEELKATYRHEPLFSIDEDTNNVASWIRSDAMISDWSGAAIEYAFALQRPVVYVDTPQKLSNLEWHRISPRAAEAEIRREIGQVVPMSAVGSIPRIIAEAVREPGTRERALLARSRWVFNIGAASAVAAQYLAS